MLDVLIDSKYAYKEPLYPRRRIAVLNTADALSNAHLNDVEPQTSERHTKEL